MPPARNHLLSLPMPSKQKGDTEEAKAYTKLLTEENLKVNLVFPGCVASWYPTEAETDDTV
jgi:hypothetical protein